jgi:O-antigen biosynthesis protein WbqP
MKRFADLTAACLLLLLLIVPMLCIALAIKLTSRGSVLHFSTRVGKGNCLFKMPKFRTMRVDAPQLATHLLADPEQWITPLGAWLRKTSLDELPQLWNILVGNMSFVGPRPALFNQYDLVELRSSHGVDQLLPGLTGWAQINGRDHLSISEKVALDAHYLQHHTLQLDASILLQTFFKVALADGVANPGPRTTAAIGRRAA